MLHFGPIPCQKYNVLKYSPKLSIMTQAVIIVVILYLVRSASRLTLIDTSSVVAPPLLFTL